MGHARHLPQNHLAAAPHDHHMAALRDARDDVAGRGQHAAVVDHARAPVRELLVALREHQLEIARAQHRVDRPARSRALQRALQKVAQPRAQRISALVALRHLAHGAAQLPRGVDQHGLIHVFKAEPPAQQARHIARSAAVLAGDGDYRHTAPPGRSRLPRGVDPCAQRLLYATRGRCGSAFQNSPAQRQRAAQLPGARFAAVEDARVGHNQKVALLGQRGRRALRLRFAREAAQRERRARDR